MDNIEYFDPIGGKMIGRRVSQSMVAVHQHHTRLIDSPPLRHLREEQATRFDGTRRRHFIVALSVTFGKVNR
jgi:hypothetical protein